MRVLKCDPVRLHKAKVRRDDLAAARLCINGAHHGRAMIGPRCPECAAQHRRHDILPAFRRAHLAALRLVRELRVIAAASANAPMPVNNPVRNR